VSGDLRDWFHSHWKTIVAVIEQGGTPDVRHIAMALRKGEQVPSEAQAYIADLLTQKKQGRPKQTPVEIEFAQWQRAEDLTRAIRIIRRRNGMCSVAKACAIFAGRGKMVSPTSIQREHRKALEITKRRRAEWAVYTEQAAGILGETPRQMIRRTLKAAIAERDTNQDDPIDRPLKTGRLISFPDK
jgi:hypothetical protein